MKEIKTEKGVLIEDPQQMFGVATYLALFNSWSLDYSNRYYKSNETDSVIIFGNKHNEIPKRKTNFKSIDEVNAFCTEMGIKLVGTKSIDHPLAHGLPDCRSIRR